MPVFFDDFNALARHKSKLGDQAAQLEANIAKLSARVFGDPDAPDEAERGARGNLFVLDKAAPDAQFVKRLQGLLDAVDTVFPADALDPNERLFLKRDILQIFDPKSLLPLDQGLASFLGESYDQRGENTTLGGTFIAAANGKHFAVIHVNLGQSGDGLRLGVEAPAVPGFKDAIRLLGEDILHVQRELRDARSERRPPQFVFGGS